MERQGENIFVSLQTILNRVPKNLLPLVMFIAPFRNRLSAPAYAAQSNSQ